MASPEIEFRAEDGVIVIRVGDQTRELDIRDVLRELGVVFDGS